MVSLAIYQTVNPDLPQTFQQGNKTKALYSMLPVFESLREPEDFEEDDRCWMYPTQVSTQRREDFRLLVDEFMEESQGKRKEPNLSTYRRHMEQLLLNLINALFMHRWLLIALDEKAYREDDVYIKAGWQFRTMRAVVKHFEEDGLVYLRKGARYNKQPLRTRIYPTPALAPYLYPFVLDTVQTFDGPYVATKRPSDHWKAVMDGVTPMEEPELIKINQFLKEQDWACKAPIRLIYNQDFLNGGRLYTAYQNLPTRKADIRKKTLINGEPLCEVDFSANQLRLQLAVLFEQDAGEYPYDEIALLSKVYDREKVKAFMVIAFGANSREKAAKACWKKQINRKQFIALESATITIYPKIKLFDGWTHQGQNLEGQILKKVMLKGVDEGVVCLPVHDAVAVQRRHEAWAVRTMISTWTDVVGCDVQPRVKVDIA